ncbi:MAG: 23S rRNA (pseudouridine(1915)-N(3))-methyltransferase RlmH [Acidobacteriota bacterium]|nr:23S rRNA (pseudouridine(1915)-N(3))-methyltransferase RlmH [Acidobacteriota bacterium]MEC7900729.1 23S rRNA (pseudouridine(1915)-N(3))-methyltransferase RlmH [Acidobacteriota bacterium]MEC8944114.1 23S rRNA (pseudouridine(1915)-N(3))-methyltransferase RlmH [Acidobacteriota bacterium]
MPNPPGIILCWPGKTTAEYARLGIEEYLSRIDRWRTCKCVVTSEEPSGRQYSEEHRLERQGKTILRRLEAFNPVFLVVLHQQGRSLDSQKFAELLQRQCYDDARTLAFVVGGPAGVASGVCDRADLLLGLSSMTLPHDMARLVLTEQIYRAFTIIHGMPYSR